MIRKLLSRQPPRGPLVAARLNRALDVLERATGSRPAPGLARFSGPGGDHDRVVPTAIAYTAKTTSTIAARSGTAPGTGTVTVQDFDGTNYSDSSIHLTAYNQVAGTIASGQYVTILRESGGWWNVVVADCT